MEDVLLREKQFLLDVADHFRCGGGGEGEDGNLRKELPYFGNFEIGRTEVVAPLGDAVGFVHGQHRHGHSLQVDAEQVGFETFWRHVQKPHLLIEQTVVDGVADLLVGHSRKDGAGFDVPFPQVLHLILHQGDERGDDDAESAQGEGGHLEADGLAAAGGQQGERVPPVQDGEHDVLLQGTERVVAPILLQNGADFRQTWVFHNGCKNTKNELEQQGSKKNCIFAALKSQPYE